MKERGEVFRDRLYVKLPGHRPGLPGHIVASGKRAKEIFVHIVPLDPAYKAGLAGHGPANQTRITRLWKCFCRICSCNGEVYRERDREIVERKRKAG